MTYDFGDALALAKTRWALFCTHDLPDDTWLGLFEAYGCCIVLQAIRGQAALKFNDPAMRYHFLLSAVEKLAAANPNPPNRVH